MNEADPKTLALWERLDAFRELLSDGGSLLGEVTTLVQNAELSLARFAELQDEHAELRSQLEDCRKERDAALRELEAVQVERRRTPVLKYGEREQSPAIELERRLRAAEQELQELRRTLSEERERRNRAISLIRPGSPLSAAENREHGGLSVP